MFKNFNNICIDNDIGVSPADKASKLIARQVEKLNFKSALDVGTGTGFIAIYLKTLGFNCEGVDINPKSIECARKNAEKNNAKINFNISDLFENVKNKFDLIIFNLPYGNIRSVFLSRYLEAIKSLLPKKNQILLKLSFRLFQKQRTDLIKRFLKEFSNFLKKDGTAAILIHKLELNLVKDFPFKIIKDYKDLRLILLEPHRLTP